jgi:membrane-associated protease RseP (regulator of RpoE activity)
MKRRVLPGLVVFSLLLSTAASRSNSIQSKGTSQESIVTIPFEMVNRHIVLKVQVDNSRPLSFVLDTGDQFAIINLERARELGLKLEGEIHMGGAGSAISTGSFVRDSKFTIPGFPGFSQPLKAALPIGGMAARFGQDFDGIIGSEFIKQFVLELDYQARVIKLYDKDKFNYAGSGESIPITLNSAGHPIIEAEVTPMGSAPITGKFVLDVGSGGALALYSPFVAGHNLLAPTLPTIKAIGVGGAGGEVTARIGRVSELKIGRFQISQPITLFSEDKVGAFASPALVGNIGQQIVGKFKLLFDYSHHRIIFEPNDSFNETFDRAFSGLSIVAEGKDYRTFRIADVLENSPGTDAGLQKDDTITAIDGKPVADFSLTRMLELFERPVAYKLTIRRGAQTMQATLTPRKLV